MGEAKPYRPAIITVPGVGRVERAPDLAHRYHYIAETLHIVCMFAPAEGSRA